MGVPTVSVLMSVKDGMPYVRETVESVLAQTFQDWEFVIVDNASSDDTVPVVERFVARDQRIRLIANARDLGHSGGLNRGLEACRARWVARIDADDVALPYRLERQLAFVRANPLVKVTSCLAYYINASGRRVGKTHHDLTTRDAFARYMEMNEAIGLVHPGVLMDRRVVEKVGRYREAFGPANDIDLWGRISERGHLILVQPECLMEYRVHPGAIGTRFLQARMKYEWARACTRARRAGLPEPTWAAFLDEWNSAPWWRRVNRWRKITAKRLYRMAGLNWATGHRLDAVTLMTAAAFLQPTYTLPRLYRQRLP